MKNYKFILFLLIWFPVSLIAQNTATANFTASVTIIEPVEIHTTANMNFANIDARQGGSVILNPDNSRTVTGDILLEASNNASAAVFEITGQDNHAYDIIVPEGDHIMSNGSKNIILKDFKLNLGIDPLKSSRIVRMGATLEIEASQEPGRYITPTPLEITLSYN